jgi:rod shape-determining protein MreD
MKETSQISYFVFISSILLGFFLELLPAPAVAIWFKPQWLMLIALAWICCAPNRVSVVFAWLLGLMLDAMKGSLLGEHALAMLIVAFCFYKMQRRFRLYPLWQQALMMLVLTFLYQLIIYIVQGAIGQLPYTTLYWGACATSMIIWPWIYVLVRDWNLKLCRS